MNPYPTIKPIQSPCIKVCEMDTHTKLCKGCLRTIEEIAYWSTMSNSARERTIREIEKRRSDRPFAA